MGKRICKQPSCGCEAQSGWEYCSGYCCNVDQSDALPGYGDYEGVCCCGHAHCRPALHHEPERSHISVGEETGPTL